MKEESALGARGGSPVCRSLLNLTSSVESVAVSNRDCVGV